MSEKVRKIVIVCPGGDEDGLIGGPTRPIDIQADGIENPIEVLLLLQMAQGAIQQKLAEQARVIIPPYI